ncbi:MAG: hypothetical protein ACTSRH_08635 [Promethearchaeota archaeon]
MTNEITWSYSIVVVLFSCVTSYFVFLLVEVIWGDFLKDFLVTNYQLDHYFNINLILFIGLILIFLISLLINLLSLPRFTLTSRLIANIFSFAYTLLFLFFISWISIIIVYDKQYSQLDLITQINLSAYFFCIFAIYILPEPIWFWNIALFIYHAILIILIKLFLIRKNLRKDIWR